MCLAKENSINLEKNLKSNKQANEYRFLTSIQQKIKNKNK